jgi:hypothetical protein
MDIASVSDEQYYLEKLSIYLNYELSSSVLLFLSYAWEITLVLSIIAATLFTPYMLYIFYRLRKIAWIISFVIVVIIPFIIFTIIGLKVGYLAAFVLIPLGFFYFYCFILKFSVSDQLKEISTRGEFKKKRDEEEKEKLLWQKQFEK